MHIEKGPSQPPHLHDHTQQLEDLSPLPQKFT
jgi:hypothetical protein